jgi:pimeloyl-ACP methyl ester carboxylesterase
LVAREVAMLAALPLLARRAGPVGLVLLLAAGCAFVRVDPGPGPSVTGSLRASVPGDSTLSSRTIQELYRRDLLALYPTSLDELAARLHADALNDPDPAVLFALSEVNYLRGRKLEKEDDPRATICYFRSAGYAYHFLLGAKGGAAPFDPRFRVACDLYNTALARCLMLAQLHGQLDAGGRWWLPGREDKDALVPLAVSHVGFQAQPAEFGRLHLCSSFRVVGLATLQRTFGLGVPLVGERSPDANATGLARSFVPADLNFSITAFCRFEGGLDDLVESPRAVLELINPLAISAVTVSAREVPLETDVTTPLAHYLGQARMEKASYSAFLSPEALGKKAGLHFLEPYRPGKVPVILVHGLLSSPAAWAPMLNDLFADPQLRERCRLAVYFYPSGAPYLVTAADLRGEIDRYRRTVDPAGKDAMLGEAVVVGHSMGGLIARLLTVDGGDDFWSLLSPAPLEKFQAPPAVREELRRTYYFRRDPSVRRVVFIGTPHKGSQISPSLLGRLAARLAGVPRPLLDTRAELALYNPQLRGGGDGQVPTSIDLLAPGTPALTLIAHRPRPEGAHYHSVIGVSLSDSLCVERLFGGDGKTGDGVVLYESAHLDGVDSELVVQANHYRVVQHPLAIREVRRILTEHLQEIDSRRGHAQGEVVPAAATSAR